jgi:polysaccharide biosynthesis PFTS motif protein
MAAWYKYSLPNNKCFKYVFTINGHIYRPLWTYYCSEKIDFLFYAASYSQYETKYGVPPPELGFASMTWPKLYMWNNEYANWTERLFKNSYTKIIKTDNIWYSDEKLIVNFDKKQKHIILFDVPPAKLSSLLPMGNYPLYRTYKNSITFLEDIYKWATDNNYVILWKKKRDKSIHSNIRYWSFCDSFEVRPGVLAIDSNVSAYKLIKEFGGPVISAPFTSTAFIASELNIKSIFYDPTESIFKTDRGCQGVKLISGSTELGNWFNDL